MSLQYAPVTKGLMIAGGLASLMVAIFDVKHYFHLQLVPHLSRDHQYWRLLTHHLVYANSSELFIWELLLYNVGVNVERSFGSAKYASYLWISMLVSTILEFTTLLVFHRSSGFNRFPPGPTALIFSIAWQYYRLVPSIYRFSIFGVVLTDRVFPFLLASQLAISQPWASTALALIGLLTGAIYRSDVVSLKRFRLPPSLLRLSSKYLLPLVGEMRPPQRLSRALPDESTASSAPAAEAEPEPITTARPQPPSESEAPSPATATREEGTGSSRSVMREWVNELTGRTERASTGIRVPSEAEISQVMSMFPELQRDVVVGALQRSSNIEGAVETLLHAA
ncbi:hypothetical protein PENSPDRAFT_646568 [Peniophora sp. CONT]|nr:hypothetical protein PENSPDRAFT_646568 [Peniophora sp. CONT]